MDVNDLEHNGVQLDLLDAEINEAAALRNSDRAVTLVLMKSGTKFAVFNRDGFCGIYEPDCREEKHSAGPVDVYEFVDWPPNCWRRPKTHSRGK